MHPIGPIILEDMSDQEGVGSASQRGGDADPAPTLRRDKWLEWQRRVLWERRRRGRRWLDGIKTREPPGGRRQHWRAAERLAFDSNPVRF